MLESIYLRTYRGGRRTSIIPFVAPDQVYSVEQSRAPRHAGSNVLATALAVRTHDVQHLSTAHTRTSTVHDWMVDSIWYVWLSLGATKWYAC